MRLLQSDWSWWNSTSRTKLWIGLIPDLLPGNGRRRRRPTSTFRWIDIDKASCVLMSKKMCDLKKGCVHSKRGACALNGLQGKACALEETPDALRHSLLFMQSPKRGCQNSLYRPYRIAGIFHGYKCSWFSRIRHEPRTLKPRI